MCRSTCLLAALVLFAAGPYVSMPSAATPYTAGGDIEIVVNGTPLPRYAHAGRWYVEALKGREYAIRIQNPYPVRVAVALAVDGLNTIDARQTSAADARKWVVGPFETVTISGWQTSRTDARRFEFTTEERSYAQALGRTANLGVISAVFFRERAPVITYRSDGRDEAPTPRAAAPAEGRAGGVGAAGGRAKPRDEDYAATGMGSRTAHAVTEVRMDLEHVPAHAVDIRYEFRPQLVRLGVLPAVPWPDPLQRRERASGFEPGFAPEPPSLR